LFDEIEKASDSLWQLLLGILDNATLTLGDNRRVDLSQVMIFLTSNLGGGEITELMSGGMGFVQPVDKPADALDGKVTRTAQEAARRKFSPEFMNRLDKVVVFHPLRPVQLEQILEIELSMVQRRVLDTAKGQFLFRVTPAARNFLLQEGTDLKYGARHLKRAIERHIVYPLANLLATSQVHLGDLLCIDWDEREQKLVFDKEGEGAVLPIAPPAAAAAAGAQSAKATGGKPAEAPPADSAEDLGFQRRTGLRAAPTSSRRPTRVECGAVFTKSGCVAASSAIERMASIKRSHSSLDSDSVGSIIIAPGTMSGNAVV